MSKEQSKRKEVQTNSTELAKRCLGWPDKKILMADYHSWDSFFKIGNHHYAEIFLKNKYDVAWISHPISPLHFLKRENLSRFLLWIQGGRNYEKVFSYTPLTVIPYLNLSFLGNKWVTENNLRFSFPPLRWVLRKNRFEKVDIFWLSDPTMGYLRNVVDCEKVVFRIHDEMTEFADSPSSISEIESDLVMKADAVFVTSMTVFMRIKGKRKDAIYLPNGVDYERFANSQSPEPKEYKKLEGPKVIYVGAIDSWFDVELLYKVSVELPEYNFILIGPSRINLSKLSALRNVFILGAKRYEEIPGYLKHADIGIIPFVKNKLTDSISPIKLYEYWAAGLPAVSADLEEIKSCGKEEIVLLAKNDKEYSIMLRNQVKRAKNLEGKCKAFAYQNSWDSRFQIVRDVLGM